MYPKNLGYSIFIKKLPKANYHPMGENSPNLVTLFGCDYTGRKEKKIVSHSYPMTKTSEKSFNLLKKI
jgi:hypothetical protein